MHSKTTRNHSANTVNSETSTLTSRKCATPFPPTQPPPFHTQDTRLYTSHHHTQNTTQNTELYTGTSLDNNMCITSCTSSINKNHFLPVSDTSVDALERKSCCFSKYKQGEQEHSVIYSTPGNYPQKCSLFLIHCHKQTDTIGMLQVALFSLYIDWYRNEIPSQVKLKLLNILKTDSYKNLPHFWSCPETFEKKWSIAQVRKRLRYK